MIKTFKYKLYPTKNQVKSLEHQLSEACSLYNAAVQERRDSYRVTGKSVSYYTQAVQLKSIRDEKLNDLANFSCCQAVLRRVEKNYQAFFSRLKKKQKTSPPRFRSRSLFDSLPFPTYGDGCKLRKNGKLYIQGVGELRIFLHRPLQGKIKNLTVKRSNNKYYACFCCDIPDSELKLPSSDKEVGIDLGLKSFAVYSDGTVIPNPREFVKNQKRLRVAQRSVSRKKKGSSNRKKAQKVVRGLHEKIRNRREDFQHKLSREIVNTYGTIVVEDLNVLGLSKGMLSKHVNDAAWGGFLNKLSYKAESAGRRLIKVNPNGTTQRCSTCSTVVAKTLADRWHHCPNCGLSVDRDLNSALEILRLGRSLSGRTSIAIGSGRSPLL